MWRKIADPRPGAGGSSLWPSTTTRSYTPSSRQRRSALASHRRVTVPTAAGAGRSGLPITRRGDVTTRPRPRGPQRLLHRQTLGCRTPTALYASAVASTSAYATIQRPPPAQLPTPPPLPPPPPERPPGLSRRPLGPRLATPVFKPPGPLPDLEPPLRRLRHLRPSRTMRPPPHYRTFASVERHSTGADAAPAAGTECSLSPTGATWASTAPHGTGMSCTLPTAQVLALSSAPSQPSPLPVPRHGTPTLLPGHGLAKRPSPRGP